MDAQAPKSAGTTGESQHDIPAPPPAPADAAIVAGPFVANPFEYEDAPPRPGQLSNGWRSLFLAGWVGVLIGFGCIWQAGRVAGIAPWWLGPETNPRSVLLIGMPFAPPLVAIAGAIARSRWAVHVGVIAAVASTAIAIGDVEYPGLALVEAAIGVAGLLISVACFAGRMRHPDRVS
jgi:hypothetical protein